MSIYRMGVVFILIVLMATAGSQSGIKCSEDIKEWVREIEIGASPRYAYMIIKIVPEGDAVVYDGGYQDSRLHGGTAGNIEQLKTDLEIIGEPRYVILDVREMIDNEIKQRTFFINWLLDTFPVAMKMKYESTQEQLLQEVPALQYFINFDVTEPDELNYDDIMNRL